MIGEEEKRLEFGGGPPSEVVSDDRRKLGTRTRKISSISLLLERLGVHQVDEETFGYFTTKND